MVALALPVAVEAALRLWRPTPCPSAAASELMACLHTYSQDYGWELRRDVELTLPHGHIRVDGDGRRVLPGRLAGGRPRLVSLGDSVAFGLEVDDQARLAAQLQALAPGVEVVDLSVPGYGTDQELLKLEREGLALAPSAVLLNFCLANDLVDNALPTFLYDGVHPKPYFRVEDGALRLHAEHLRLPAAARAALWLSERSVLFNLVSPGRPARVLAERSEGEAPHWQTRYNEAMARPEPLVALAARLIERMAEHARGAGARLVVVTHPTRRSFAEGTPAFEADLRERLGRAGVPVASLADRYRARGLALSALATDGLGHLNERGHRAAAEAIASVLAEAPGPLSSSPPPPE